LQGATWNAPFTRWRSARNETPSRKLSLKDVTDSPPSSSQGDNIDTRFH
jgi:hypothetical protein